MKVAFFQPFLNVRGSTVALYDYAYYNEQLLSNESLVIYEKNDSRNDDTAIKRFDKNFIFVNPLYIMEFIGYLILTLMNYPFLLIIAILLVFLLLLFF